jgi:hypothetical protein
MKKQRIPWDDERRKQNREAIAQLAAKGLVYDSGERRDGAIVWKLTPKGEERLRTEDSRDDRLPPEGEALLTAFKRIEAGDE